MSIIYIYPPEERACKALWLAVIYQAMIDLILEPENNEEDTGQREAYRWFFLSNGNFPMVCRLANVEPLAIRKRAKEVFNDPSLMEYCNV